MLDRNLRDKNGRRTIEVGCYSELRVDQLSENAMYYRDPRKVSDRKRSYFRRGLSFGVVARRTPTV